MVTDINDLKLLIIDQHDRIFFDGKELPQKVFGNRDLYEDIRRYKKDRWNSITTGSLIHLLSLEYPELKGYQVYYNGNRTTDLHALYFRLIPTDS